MEFNPGEAVKNNVLGTKIVADAETNDMLGMTIVGPHATELIGGLAMGRLLDVTPEGLVLVETAPGVSRADVEKATEPPIL